MVFKSNTHPKSGRIKVTHYVNPHEFWIKYDDDKNKTVTNEIQQKIHRLGNLQPSNFNHVPLIGEIVIVRFFGNVEKFVRARVDHELKESTEEFILWAIDEGYPIQTSKKWIAKLTDADIQNENSLVYKVTINDIVPATTQYNIVEETSEIVSTRCWSEKAITEFGKLLNAPSLIFHYDCHSSAQHLFGSIEIISPAGKSINGTEVLKALNEAKTPTDFEVEYQNLITESYWLREHKNFKIKENVKGTICPPEVATLPLNNKPFNKVDGFSDESSVSSSQESNISQIPYSKRFRHLISMSRLKLSEESLEHEDNDISSTLPSVNGSSSRSSPMVNGANSLSMVNDANSLSMVNDANLLPMVTGSRSSPKVTGANSLPLVYSSRSSPLLNSSGKSALPNFKNAEIQNNELSRKINDRVLMHIPEELYITSISRISEANFTEEVLQNLKTLGISKINRIQAVIWPHLMRAYSLMLINESKTGKTYAYLPAVCSLLMEYHDDGLIVNAVGPVMIIICGSSSGVRKIVQHCRFLLSNKFSCEAVYGKGTTNDIEEKLLSDCDILVTTVRCLLDLTSNRPHLFNKERITTIVFDEIDVIIARYGEGAVAKVYNEFCFNSKIQSIVISKTWHEILRMFCQKNDLLICIGEYIEAAFYSKIEFAVHLKDQMDPYGQFLNFIKKINFDDRIVVFCRDYEEVMAIKNIIKTELNSDVEFYSMEKNFEKYGQKGVPIVCTDDALEDLDIRKAQHIIHFSLPEKLSTFKKRFIVSRDYCKDLVLDRLKASRPTSLVFFDYENIDRELIEFLNDRCCPNKEGLVGQSNFEVATPHTRSCIPQRSTSRLAPVKENWEMLQPGEFHEIDFGEFFSPNRFYVLLARQFERFQELKQDIYEFTSNSRNFKPLRQIVIGQICLATVSTFDNNIFTRGKIILVGQSTVDIFMVDYGIEEYKVPLKNLIEIPERFIQSLPFQAIHCKMTGIRPCNRSDRWTDDACDKIQKVLKECPEVFVISTGKQSVTRDIIKCNSYDVVFLDKSHERNINRLVVRRNLAEFDPQSKSFTYVSVNWNSLGDDSNEFDDDDAAFLNSDERRMQHNFSYSERSDMELLDEWIPRKSQFHAGGSEASSQYSKNGKILSKLNDRGSEVELADEWLSLPTKAQSRVEGSQASSTSSKIVKEILQYDPSIAYNKRSNVELADEWLYSPNITRNNKEGSQASTSPNAIVNEVPECDKTVNSSASLKMVEPTKPLLVIWEQTSEMVNVFVTGPDIKNYSLKVGQRFVHFSFGNSNEKLNLYESVDAKSTSHEAHGDTIVVRLKKASPAKHWPQLVQSEDGNRFTVHKLDECDDASIKILRKAFEINNIE